MQDVSQHVRYAGARSPAQLAFSVSRRPRPGKLTLNFVNRDGRRPCATGAAIPSPPTIRNWLAGCRAMPNNRAACETGLTLRYEPIGGSVPTDADPQSCPPLKGASRHATSWWLNEIKPACTAAAVVLAVSAERLAALTVRSSGSPSRGRRTWSRITSVSIGANRVFEHRTHRLPRTAIERRLEYLAPVLRASIGMVPASVHNVAVALRRRAADCRVCVSHQDRRAAVSPGLHAGPRATHDPSTATVRLQVLCCVPRDVARCRALRIGPERAPEAWIGLA